MKKNKGRIFVLILAGVVAAYAITFIVYNIATNNDITSVVINSIIVFTIGFVLDIILIMSSLGVLKGKGSIGGYAAPARISDIGSQYDGPFKPNPYYTDEWKETIKRERTENRIRVVGARWEAREKPTKANIIIGLSVLVLLSGVAALMFWLEHRELNKYNNNPNYTSTVAVAQYVRMQGDDRYEIKYVYSDANGKLYVLKHTGHLDGYTPSVGTEINVYYPNNNPSAAQSVEDAKMLTVGAVLFLSIGLLVLLINIFPNNNSVLCAGFGSMFVAVGATFVGGIAMYTHMGILGAMLSNGVAFGLTCLAMCGAALAIYGFYTLAQSAYYLILYVKCGRE